MDLFPMTDFSCGMRDGERIKCFMSDPVFCIFCRHIRCDILLWERDISLKR